MSREKLTMGEGRIVEDLKLLVQVDIGRRTRFQRDRSVHKNG